ncbi:MAG: aminotransferase class I/II-fold pyridoxal phosphate-dependent enzyme [Planctomycetota bacterium]|nr:MAG: aminotransferase class I/II-fold pyridoxal phosphate-dependent enzyme [Planctomycetota bacterium]
MGFAPSGRLDALSGYAFAEVRALVEKLSGQGITPIDFGVGDPTAPTPELIRERLKTAVEERASSGYPSYVGSREYLEAIAAWTKRRFGVELDPGTEITSTVGSKEGIFNFPEAVLNPGDIAIIPSPGYPPYTRGTLFAEGEIYNVPIREDNGFLVDFDSIPVDAANAAKICWINYPNSPSGRVAPPEFFERAVAFGKEHDVLIASDEAYTEIYFTGEPPHSLLEFARENVVVFQSMSKRSAMTGWRIGWTSGDPAVITAFKKLKTNIDSGTPTFIQDAAIAALEDESHVASFRDEYREKRDVMCAAFRDAGLPDCTPESTLYIWQRAPEGMTSVGFAKRLLEPEIAVVATPGEWISETCPDGANPGAGYVRFALVPSIERVREAAGRIRNMKW